MEEKSLKQQQKNWEGFLFPFSSYLHWIGMRELCDAAQFRTTPLCQESELQDEKQTWGYLSVWHLGMCLHCRIGVPGTQLKVLVPAVLTVQMLPHSWALSQAFSKINSGQVSGNSSFQEQLPKSSKDETIPVWFPPPYMSLQQIPSNFAPSETLMAFRTSDMCS